MTIPTNPSIALYLQNNPDELEEVKEMDRKILKAKEIAIFHEETKIWQLKLSRCSHREGVNAPMNCKELAALLTERSIYSDSKFDEKYRPKVTPGLPSYVYQ